MYWNYFYRKKRSPTLDAINLGMPGEVLDARDGVKSHVMNVFPVSRPLQTPDTMSLHN